MAFKMKGFSGFKQKKNSGSMLKKAIPDDAKGLNKMIKSETGKKAAKKMGFTKDSTGALLKKGAFKQDGRVFGSKKEPRITATQGRSANSFQQLLKQIEQERKKREEANKN